MSVLVAIAVVATFALWLTRGWVSIGVPHFDPELEPFSDAYVVLWGPEECAAGRGEWVGTVCFIPSLAAPAHAQSYEPWLTFHRWGLGSARHVLVAAIMIALFYLAFALTMKPARVGELAYCIAALATPAVQLGVERANFDLLICAMLCVAARTMGSTRPAATAAGTVLLGAATALKLYTGIASVSAWIFCRPRRVSTAAAALVATLAAVWIIGPDAIAVLNRGTPEGETRFSTGAHWLFRHRGAAAGAFTVAITSFIAILAGIRLAAAPAPRYAAHPYREMAFYIAFLVAVPLYFLKDSYDYRLVLLLPGLALPLAWLREDLDGCWRMLAWTTLALFLVVAGIELPCAMLDRFSAPGGSDAAAVAIAALVYIKQAAAWLLIDAFILTFLFGLRQRLGSSPGLR